MDIDQIEQFLRLAELGNFTRVAELLGLSQPALSRSIQRLEDQLGQPLLERQTRQVVLTDAGRLFLPRAQQILATWQDAKAQIVDDGQTGIVRIAAIPTIAPYFLPRLLAMFCREYPQAKTVVQEETTERLLRDLSQGQIDVMIAAQPIEFPHVEVRTLFPEELKLVMSAKNPLRQKKSIRISDLEKLPFILLGEAHCLTNNVLSFCQQKAFHPVSVERTSQLATVQELVALDHGVSLVPEMARRFDHSKRRMYRSLSGTEPARTIVAVTNPYRFQSRLQKAFLQVLYRYADDFHNAEE